MFTKDFLTDAQGKIRSFLVSRYSLFLHGNIIAGLGEGAEPDHAARLQDIAVLKTYVDNLASSVSEKTVFLDEHTGFYRIHAGEKVVTHLGCASVTVLLPPVVHLGEKFAVLGGGTAGGWVVAQNEGQQILYGHHRTTSGEAGGIRSTTPVAYARLCVVGPGIFVVESSSDTLEIF